MVHKDPMRTLLKALYTAQTEQEFEEGFDRLRRLLNEGEEANIGKMFQCYVSTGSLLATQVNVYNSLLASCRPLPMGWVY